LATDAGIYSIVVDAPPTGLAKGTNAFQQPVAGRLPAIRAAGNTAEAG
jgi:hypothetical protein